MTAHRIIVAQCPRRNDGSFNPDFMAWYQGELIVAASREPLFEACRVLLARGLSGPIEMWDRSQPFQRMRTTIETGASLTVEESGTGARFRKWRASRVERPWAAKSGAEVLVDHPARGRLASVGEVMSKGVRS
jgi:hypothetical protein